MTQKNKEIDDLHEQVKDLEKNLGNSRAWRQSLNYPTLPLRMDYV